LAVSKQDSQFFNVFSLVIGLLVAVAIVLMVLARGVGASTQKQHVLEDQKYRDEVAARVKPFARVAVAGQDNSALAIVEKAPGDAGAAALPKDGNEVFQQACSACHAAGIAGAPKAGDKAAWAPRIAQGKDTLYKHAIEGYQGKAGVMPARGGRVDLTDDLVKAGVDHMVDLAR
jgi:cytochrome c5